MLYLGLRYFAHTYTKKCASVPKKKQISGSSKEYQESVEAQMANVMTIYWKFFLRRIVTIRWKRLIVMRKVSHQTMEKTSVSALQVFHHLMIRFGDASSRRRNRSTYKLQPIRDMFEEWDLNLRDVYTPDPHMTVDEQLVCFRGRCPFWQYIPSKLGKYGIKVLGISVYRVDS